MRCVIIAGSPDTDVELLKNTISNDDYVICADRGFLYAQQAGILPAIVVGDFDSYDGILPESCEIITLNPHKDDTDTIHAIDVAFDRGMTDFLIIGGIGGRFDHTFANVTALMYIAQKGGRGELISEKEKILFLKKGAYSFDKLNGHTFSVFPFGCQEAVVSYCGAEYPLENGKLSANVPLGVSNVFTENHSTIKISDGNVIIVINLIKV